MITQSFPQIVEDVLLFQRTDALKSFEISLHLEFFSMLAGARAVVHYSTERITFIPERTLSFLHRDVLDGKLHIGRINSL